MAFYLMRTPTKHKVRCTHKNVKSSKWFFCPSATMYNRCSQILKRKFSLGKIKIKITIVTVNDGGPITMVTSSHLL